MQDSYDIFLVDIILIFYTFSSYLIDIVSFKVQNII